MTGSSFRQTLQENQAKQHHMVDQAVAESLYRAWHKAEKTFYPVLGVDWFHHKVLILQSAAPQWLDVELFMLMPWSGLRDQKRTQQYPEGQKIYIGDIIQFPILLQQNGEVHKTMVLGTVIFDRDRGCFAISEIDDGDLLIGFSHDCEIIGSVCERPDLIPPATAELWHSLLNNGTAARIGLPLA
jgi:hypothetical protein